MGRHSAKNRMAAKFTAGTVAFGAAAAIMAPTASAAPDSDWDRLAQCEACLLYTSPSPRDATLSRMPSSA